MGPGTYTSQKIDRKPQSMFLPREGLRNRSPFTNTGSIRDNHDFEDEMGSGFIDGKRASPGPGDYETDRSSLKYQGRPAHMQYFGTKVERFKH